jgi:hypothetical protein
VAAGVPGVTAGLPPPAAPIIAAPFVPAVPLPAVEVGVWPLVPLAPVVAFGALPPAVLELTAPVPAFGALDPLLPGVVEVAPAVGVVVPSGEVVCPGFSPPPPQATTSKQLTIRLWREIVRN